MEFLWPRSQLPFSCLLTALHPILIPSSISHMLVDQYQDFSTKKKSNAMAASGRPKEA
jgi:hypothetical protein